MNILFLANELSLVNGINKHLFHLIKGLANKYPSDNYYLICGGGDDINKYQSMCKIILVTDLIKHQKRSKIRFVLSIKKIFFFVKRHKIDIIHSHHFYAGNIAQIVSKLTFTKTILTNHGIIPNQGTLKHYPADYLIVLSSYIYNYIIINDIKKQDKVHLISHGFPIIKMQKKNIDKIRVISGGRFIEGKGFDIYINAIAKLPRKVKDIAEFYIAGGGILESFLRKLAKEVGIKLNFLGKIDNLQEALFNYDIFILATSRADEGFPTILIEAAIANMLLISSDSEVLDKKINEQNAFIFEKDNINQLTMFLKESIENYHKFDYKRQNLFDLAKEEFDLDKTTIKIHNLYSQLS